MMGTVEGQMMDKPELVKVVRVLEYVGPLDWVRGTLASSYIAPSLSERAPDVTFRGEIREVYISSPKLIAEIRGLAEDAPRGWE